MHKEKFLIYTIALSLVLMTPSEIFGQKKGPRGLISVKQEASLTIDNLKKNLKKETDQAKRFALIEKYKKDAAEARSKAPRQLEEDEIFLNLLESSFAHLPSEADFNRKNCKVYRNKFLFELHPMEKEPIPSPVEMALDILKILCK